MEVKKGDESDVEPKKEEEKKEEKEYKEVKAGDKGEDTVKPVQKKLNEILPEDFKIVDDGKYGDKTKKALERIIPLLKISGAIPDDYKLDTSKITVEIQKAMDEYIKKLPELKKQLF